MNLLKGVGLYVGGMFTGIGIGALGASVIIAIMLIDDKRHSERRSSRVDYNPTYSKYFTGDTVRRND